MKSQPSEALRAFWSNQRVFMPTDSVAAAWSFLRDFGRDVTASGLPKPLRFLAIGIGVGLVTLLRDRVGRAALVLIVGIFAGVVIASALGLYPVHPGRLAAFHRPLAPILLAIGIYGCLRWLPRPSRSIVFVLAAAAALPFAERSFYRATGDADAVRAVTERTRPNDTIITFLRAAHALGYYTPDAVEIVREPRLGSGFVARLSRPHVYYLWLGPPETPKTYEEIDAQLDSALTAATDRIIFMPPRFGTEMVARRSNHVVSRILDTGYRPSGQDADRSPHVLVLERSPDPHPSPLEQTLQQ